MAEHMVCNHGVRGSTPLTSTNVVTAIEFTVSLIEPSLSDV